MTRVLYVFHIPCVCIRASVCAFVTCALCEYVCVYVCLCMCMLMCAFVRALLCANKVRTMCTRVDVRVDVRVCECVCVCCVLIDTLTNLDVLLHSPHFNPSSIVVHAHDGLLLLHTQACN